MEKCCICGKPLFNGNPNAEKMTDKQKADYFGNSAWPLADGRCCDECNEKVIFARLKMRYRDDN